VRTEVAPAREAVGGIRLAAPAKTFQSPQGPVRAVRGIDLDIAPGEFVSLLGPSGCGKTTLLRVLAGLEVADGGAVRLGGHDVSRVPTNKRDIGMVFQSYSLFPHLRVTENTAFGLRRRGVGKADAAKRALDALALVGLEEHAGKFPHQLSGGQQQRVALARALVTEPKVLLLDEPLSALDALTRAKLQDEIERIREEEKRTIILVTNDVDEALLLADRVAVLTPAPAARIGRIFDVALPRPRDREAVNDSAAFQALRSEIVGYLAGLVGEATTDTAASLPNVAPIDFAPPPKAYRDAAKGGTERRYLEFFKLHKVYPTPKGPLTVVEDFNLLMDKGEFISLIGHSGCGKSTVLTMAAGLNAISRGSIILDNREIDLAGPDKAVVFQAPSLMPWLTARQNVALGVERVYPHATRAERREIIDYYLDRVGLGDARDKLAAEMSNGMRQRVGIARAFALSPRLLLLDEPFGMLDSLTRWDLQDVLVEVWNRTKVTAVMVTHDVDEAILLADRVVMMTNGPRATIGKVLKIDLPRPRDRKALLGHPDFYAYRQEVLHFLAEYDHGPASAAA
jgi:nitrate/nitrite transport system ATP-binding protein